MKNLLITLLLLFPSSFIFSQCFTFNSIWDENQYSDSYSNYIDCITKPEIAKMMKIFKVKIHFRYGAEEGGFGNATFSKICNTNICPNTPCDGVITLGKFLIKENINKFYGEQIIISTLAHEFGHALQRKADPNFFLINPNNPKLKELHADYLAGYYIGQRGLIQRDLLEAFARDFYDKGDTAFFDQDHHGTNIERRCAFLEGYKMAIDYKFNVYQAFTAGIDYISKLYPCNANIIMSKYSLKKIEKTTFKTIQTGNYFIESSRETIYIKNFYGQVISVVKPGQPLRLNNLDPSNLYMFYPCKKNWFGIIRRLRPIYFKVESGKTNGYSIKRTALFWVSQYSIYFPN